MSDIELKISSENFAGCTVEHILRTHFMVSGTLIKKLKRENEVFIDGKPCAMRYRVLDGQVLTAKISSDIRRGKMPSFPIIYEDDDIIAVDKPHGMLVHATKVTYDEVTVASETREYLGSAQFHPINRLDRGTSGIMLIAKNGYVHNLYKSLMHTDNFIRKYIAVCLGTHSPCEREICASIGRDAVSPIKRIISADGKYAVTRYKLISSHGKYSFVEVMPATGRTHQIRVHMAHIGCPLAGDFLYGEETDDIKRYALHSYYVKFRKPTNGECVELFCDIPQDIRRLIDR